MKLKIQHKINWNYIATILAIVTIILGLYFTNNQFTVDLISQEKELLELKYSNLEKETDPVLHSKFNEMNEFYKDQLNSYDKKTKSLKKSYDSLLSISNFQPKHQFSIEQLRKILKITIENKYLLELRDLDSMKLENYMGRLSLLQMIDSNRRNIIDINDEKIKYLSVEYSKLYKHNKYNSPSAVRLLVILSFTLIIFILALLFKVIRIN